MNRSSIVPWVLAALAAVGCSTRPSSPPRQDTASSSRQAAPAPAPSTRQAPATTSAQPQGGAFVIRDHYAKHEYRIPMRDGVHLFTQVFTPLDTSHTYPFLLNRTPYSVGPYGENEYNDPAPGTSFETFGKEGFIIVRQDVRGRYMSEGDFVNVTPHKPRKISPSDTDESTDTYDTIDWLLKNIPNHNGRAGQWGISYPGFYAAAGMIDAHPALKAVSPQAPIGDWYFDDFYHHGAFFLPHYFNFFSGFGKPRPGPTTEGTPGYRHAHPDGYQFFLDLGPLHNIEDRYYKGEVAFWHDIVAHPAYDQFWKDRRILTHLKHVAPAVMTVGGWFDAEDLYGALNTYRAVEDQNPGVFNVLVMGPWAHGAWSRAPGDSLGNITFGGAPSEYYQQNIELPFFKYFLKGEGKDHGGVPEASVFETGTNRWRMFDDWPPAGTARRDLYFEDAGRLSFDQPPTGDALFDDFISDPAHPVPYTEAFSTGMTREYMTDDQRFASRRADVLTYQTEPLEQDMTLAGPLTAHLVVATTGTDADWIVKLVDVFPLDTPEPADSGAPANGGRARRSTSAHPMSGYQMMVRSEAFRGRYRHSYEHPEPFTPNTPEVVEVPLQDVLHTFQKGHRLMVQVQSTWFPLVDRNPQKYVDNIFKATDADFTKAVHRVYRTGDLPTYLRIGVIPSEPH